MKKIIALILVILNIVLICGCSDNSGSAIIYYGVKTPPTTLDPQLASTITELTLVKNLYEGLMREDENGNIVLGAAKTAEKNGNTYIFTISENAFWSDNTSVTAEDFLFGIQRALDSNTGSTDASSLYIIKNAEAVHKGNKALSSLGISAPDAKTLIIETNSENDNLYEALTRSVAMPCNRKFFADSKGKYGMSKETMLSNGSFKLTKWTTEDFAMRIYRSSAYKGAFLPKVSAVFLSIDKEESNLQRLLKGKMDIAEIESKEAKKAENNGFNVINIPNTVWLLKIGNGYTPALKKALFSSVITYNPSVSDYPEGFSPALNLYPDMFEREEKINIYNIDYAKETYRNEIKAFPDGELPETTLYFEDKQSASDLIKKLAGHWQQNLGAYINISGLSTAAQVKLKENDYSLTVYSKEINSPNLNKYANFFEIDTTDNITEKILKGNILPIAYSGTALSYSDALQNINTENGFNLIDFSYVNKNQ